MSYRIRHIPAEHNLSTAFRLEVFESVIPSQTICEVLSESERWEERERDLNMHLMVYLVMAFSLYPRLAQRAVLRKVLQGLRLVWGQTVKLVAKSAIAYRRAQLGSQPLRLLFERVCRPMATAQTRGAFWRGWRIMALDGTLEDVPDTPANVASFGRRCHGKTASPFPQLRCVYLCECGTHALVAAHLGPCRPSEHHGAHALLAWVQPDMLVTLDRGLFSAALLQGIRRKRAHALCRLPVDVLTSYCGLLSDGTYLAVVFPDDAPPLLVRVIEYTFTDPAVPGSGQMHRLVTTLLNPQTAPALELVQLYHERWEIEVSIDELDTHQRLAGCTLRSRTPEGVLQEVYGLLLAHYAIRALMHDSALQADVDPDRLSFTQAVQVLSDAVVELAIVDPAERPRLLQALLEDLRSPLLPPRLPRINPRVVKRRFSKFPKKRAVHRKVPKLTQAFHDIITLI